MWVPCHAVDPATATRDHGMTRPAGSLAWLWPQQVGDRHACHCANRPDGAGGSHQLYVAKLDSESQCLVVSRFLFLRIAPKSSRGSTVTLDVSLSRGPGLLADTRGEGCHFAVLQGEAMASFSFKGIV